MLERDIVHNGVFDSYIIRGMGALRIRTWYGVLERDIVHNGVFDSYIIRGMGTLRIRTWYGYKFVVRDFTNNWYAEDTHNRYTI